MTPTISQRVKFSASTGAPAKLSRKVGGAWSAYGGSIGGKNLLIVPDKQIVQVWRARFWKKGELSILIMTFEKAAGGAIVELVHVGVPQPSTTGSRGKNI